MIIKTPQQVQDDLAKDTRNAKWITIKMLLLIYALLYEWSNRKETKEKKND